jgi:hypothetical protein
MADIKTKLTNESPKAFIERVENERKRKDCHELMAMMKKITGEPPRMWGPSIVGFGKRHYEYESGREGEMPLAGFSPRKSGLVLYLGPTIQDTKLMAKLGKHKTGKGCLYINKLDDINRDLLRELVAKSVEHMRRHGICK